jgi:hypothetical protein
MKHPNPNVPAATRTSSRLAASPLPKHPRRGVFIGKSTFTNTRGRFNISQDSSNNTGGVHFNVRLGNMKLCYIDGYKKAANMGIISFSKSTKCCRGMSVAIDKFVVPAAHQKQGFGTAILLHLIRLYRAAGCVLLEVPVVSQTGRRLYEGCGFTRIDGFTRLYL